MLELGKHTEEAHRDIGKTASRTAKVLIAVGPRSRATAEAAKRSGMKKENVFELSNSREAGEFLKTFVQAGDLVLIKGSQGMRMERAVEAILAGPDKKTELLVRQEPEWLKRE
jgi:UDP-N-acetylmuramoyl-tripeptide--D-alanyl-D-alanine ligase